MKYLLLLIAYLAYTSALVHYLKLNKGSNGCNSDGTEIKVGEDIQDPKVCGVIQCQNKEGDALAIYCQLPPAFALCPFYNGMVTYKDFPECCWMCAKLVATASCAQSG